MISREFIFWTFFVKSVSIHEKFREMISYFFLTFQLNVSRVIADATKIRQKIEDEKTKRCKKKRKTLLTQATHTTKLSCAASAVNSQSTVSSRIDNWPPEIGKKLRGKKQKKFCLNSRCILNVSHSLVMDIGYPQKNSVKPILELANQKIISVFGRIYKEKFRQIAT